MLHEWTQSPSQAKAIQLQLAKRVETQDKLSAVNYIAGIDIGFEQQENTCITRAVITVLEYPSLKVIDYVLYKQPTTMNYIPGLLSFREVPAALEAFKQLKIKPDLIMVDGQGIAHPRRLGVASHLGLWLDIPTIGVAKSRLCGKHELVANLKGAHTPLIDNAEVIGAVLRSKEKTNPLYISSGHRVSLTTAIDWVLNCLAGYKLPEPTRQADRLASRRVPEAKLFNEWQCPRLDL